MRRPSILHAPLEVAGQLGLYCRALRDIGYPARSCCFYRHPFGYACDIEFGLSFPPGAPAATRLLRGLLLRLKKLLFLPQALSRYSLFHFHYATSLLDWHLDLPLLRFLRKRIIFHFWGDDMRRSSVAQRKNPYYYLARYDKDDSAIEAHLRRLAAYADHVIVPNFESLDYVRDIFPAVSVVRQAIDLASLQPAYPTVDVPEPLIVHAPSDRNIKGSSYIMAAIERLRGRFPFRFVLIENMSHADAIGLYRQADIVIDQLLLGEYGLVAIEAMAMGKPVICYIREDLLRERYADLPVINATIETLDDVLVMLLSRPELRVERGRAGRRYAEEHHAVTVIARQLAGIYDRLLTPKGS